MGKEELAVKNYTKEIYTFSLEIFLGKDEQPKIEKQAYEKTFMNPISEGTPKKFIVYEFHYKRERNIYTELDKFSKPASDHVEKELEKYFLKNYNRKLYQVFITLFDLPKKYAPTGKLKIIASFVFYY